LLNEALYPNFLERPQGNPTLKFTAIAPGRVEQIEGYSILATEVMHSVPAVGYQITARDGKIVFYTGDTGPGLANACWEQVSPQLLITEVTVPDSDEDFARRVGHLTPSLLKQELIGFRELKGYLPEIALVHMNPGLEKEIAAEVAGVAKALDCSINLAYEGMELHL
jgi:ribonuclease BN (tRNA processing enzyme)